MRVNKKIINIYQDTFNRYGDTIAGAGWKNNYEAKLRYESMSYLFSLDNKNKTILDIGCGTSNFYKYLKKKKIKNFKYFGIDASQSMIEISKKKFKNNIYYCLDYFESDRIKKKFDYVVANGIFTQKAKSSDKEMFYFFKKLSKKMFKNTHKGIAFNLLKEKKEVDWVKSGNYHPNFNEVMSYVKKELSTNFIINSNYKLFEYSIYVFR